MYSYRRYWVEISVPVILLYGRFYFLAAFIQSIGIVFIESKLHTFVLTPWSAPLSSSFVTTSVWPFCAARWSGVQSSCRRKNNDLNILCQLIIRRLLFFVTFHCPIYLKKVKAQNTLMEVTKSSIKPFHALLNILHAVANLNQKSFHCVWRITI